MDYPAGVVPVGYVTKGDIDALRVSYTLDNDVSRCVFEAQKDSLGMPLGVQCVAMNWRDETALRLMKEVRDVCKGITL